MVFQGYALFPHLTVLENVAFSLRRARRCEAGARRRAGAAIDLVRLTGLEGRLPLQLSGGQQQRVALARAIVSSPICCFWTSRSRSSTRGSRRAAMGAARIQRQTGVTCLYVTHDQEEALSMADRSRSSTVAG